jgi:hypothetical protein
VPEILVLIVKSYQLQPHPAALDLARQVQKVLYRSCNLAYQNASNNCNYKCMKVKGKGKGSKLWGGCEGYVSVVKWNEEKVMVKYGCISS